MGTSCEIVPSWMPHNIPYGLHDNNAKVFWIALVAKDLNGVIHSWIYL